MRRQEAEINSFWDLSIDHRRVRRIYVSSDVLDVLLIKYNQLRVVTGNGKNIRTHSALFPCQVLTKKIYLEELLSL